MSDMMNANLGAKSILWTFSLLAITLLTFAGAILDWGIGLKRGKLSVYNPFILRMSAWVVFLAMLVTTGVKKNDPIVTLTNPPVIGPDEDKRVPIVYGMYVLFFLLYTGFNLFKLFAYHGVFGDALKSRKVKDITDFLDKNDMLFKYGNHMFFLVGIISYFGVLEAGLLNQLFDMYTGMNMEFDVINYMFIGTFIVFFCIHGGYSIYVLCFGEYQPNNPIIQGVFAFGGITFPEQMLDPRSRNGKAKRLGAYDIIRDHDTGFTHSDMVVDVESKKTDGKITIDSYSMKVSEYDRYDIDYKCTELYGAPPEVFGAQHGYGFHILYKVPRPVIYSLSVLDLCFLILFYQNGYHVWMGSTLLILIPLAAAAWNGTFGSWFEHWVLSHLVWYAMLMHVRVFQNQYTEMMWYQPAALMSFTPGEPEYSSWTNVINLSLLAGVIVLLGDLVVSFFGLL
jgi:hypothetical protein